LVTNKVTSIPPEGWKEGRKEGEGRKVKEGRKNGRKEGEGRR
jgi:hypothetical protein